MQSTITASCLSHTPCVKVGMMSDSFVCYPRFASASAGLRSDSEEEGKGGVGTESVRGLRGTRGDGLDFEVTQCGYTDR
jgi:hypothetical protein